MEGTDLVQAVQRDLVAMISCLMLGQNRDCEALENMLVDPEWAAWRCCRASALRETGIRGLLYQCC